MKNDIYNLRLTSVLFLFTFSFFLQFLSAAEILSEKEWTRIISGDRATQLTRGISQIPKSTEIDQKIIRKILTELKISSQKESILRAWQKGLKEWGWAQQENEPEYETFQEIQIVVSDDEIICKNIGLYGPTAKRRFDLAGNLLSFEEIEISVSLDRTVFHTVLSPALFVQNQEHFQKQFFEGMINLDYPGLETAKKAYGEKKVLLAAHEIAEYFRRKINPIWAQELPKKTCIQR